METIETISIPIIAALVVAFFEAFKKATDEKFNKFIPALAPLVGAVFGIIVYLALPQYIPAESVISAAVIGGISGMGATGAHQMAKQLATKEDENNNGNES